MDCPPELLAADKPGGINYIAKRLLSIVVQNSDVDTVVQTIIEVNQTAQIGDGKICVCPLDTAVRVRTGERSDDAFL